MSFESLYSNMDGQVHKTYQVRYGYLADRQPSPSPKLEGDPQAAILARFSPDIIGQVRTDDGIVAVVEKSNPHTIADTMISVFGSDKSILTFGDASPPTREVVLGAMHDFVRYASDPKTQKAYNLQDTFLRIGINIDHQTGDRGALQGVRTLHPHCLCFPRNPAQQKTYYFNFAKPDHSLTAVIDPVAELAPKILNDHYQNGSLPTSLYALGEPRTNEQTIPFAFNIQLAQSWDTLLQEQTGQALADLDATLLSIYSDIKQAITGDGNAIAQPWERPSILPLKKIAANIDQLPHISDASRMGLMALARSLRSVPPRVMERLREARTAGSVTNAEKLLSFAGLTYGLTLYSPGLVGDMRTGDTWQKPSYLAIQPVLLRSSGVAGFSMDADGRLFKVERGANARSMTTDERNASRKFQRGFAQILGATALR